MFSSEFVKSIWLKNRVIVFCSESASNEKDDDEDPEREGAVSEHHGASCVIPVCYECRTFVKVAVFFKCLLYIKYSFVDVYSFSSKFGCRTV